MTVLDRIDREIVVALSNNARLSNKELAARIGLAPSSCLNRVRRLKERGVLLSFHAKVSPKALGIGIQALVAIRLRNHARDALESLKAHLLALPEVVALYDVAGSDDFVCHIAVRDSDHLRDLVRDGFSVREEIAFLQTSVIFDHVASPTLPVYAQG